MRYININGQLIKETAAAVPYNNRAFRFGYGLFETMLIRGGVIQLKEYHWDRLFSGVKELGLVMPEIMDRNWIESEVIKTVKKNKLTKFCRVRLQVYAGRGGLYDGHSMWSEFIIEAIPEKQDITELNDKGVTMLISKGIVKSNDTLSHLKSNNALVYSIAARQAEEGNCDDAFVCNASGNILESTIANVFWIKDGNLYTPPLSEGCIAGVMRRYLMEQLPILGIDVVEKPLTLSELKAAEAVFLTNAIRKIKWVSSINDNMTYTVDKLLPIYEQLSL